MSPTALSAIAPSVTPRAPRATPAASGRTARQGRADQPGPARPRAGPPAGDRAPPAARPAAAGREAPHPARAQRECSASTTASISSATCWSRPTSSPPRSSRPRSPRNGRPTRPLGETLIQLGFITERQLKHALSIQLRIAFVDLDDRPIDPELASLISESYARHHQLMPIARADDRIVLAMADPTDVERVTELRSCTGRGIDVVTTTTDALERALARAYGVRAEMPSPRPPRAETDERRPGAIPVRRVIAPASRGARSPPCGRGWTPRGSFSGTGNAGDSVDGLLGELRERRGEIARLAGELRESRAIQARTNQEHDARAEAWTRLEAAYADLVQERDALLGAFEAPQRHDALLRDRRYAIDRVEAALHRLRS